MHERPNIRLELEIPGLRIQNYLVTHNEKIEAEVKAGVDAAMEELAQEKYIETMVKNQIIEQIKKHYTGFFFKHKFDEDLRAHLNEKINSFMEKHSDRILQEAFNELKIEKEL